MPARSWLIVLLLAVLSGCDTALTALPVRVALLAPFEGEHREIGYNALYAARLALGDAGASGVDLLPIDDGGTPESAALRAAALQRDERVWLVLLIGPNAASAAAQRALGNVPGIIIGAWTNTRAAESIFIASGAGIPAQASVLLAGTVSRAAAAPSPVVTGDIGGLDSFGALRPSADGVTVLSSGQLPPVDFAARYAASGAFVPPPNLLAVRIYDLTTWAARLAALPGRAAITEALQTQTFSSAFSGPVRFGADGYWTDAPVTAFAWSDGALAVVPLDAVVE